MSEQAVEPMRSTGFTTALFKRSPSASRDFTAPDGQVTSRQPDELIEYDGDGNVLAGRDHGVEVTGPVSFERYSQDGSREVVNPLPRRLATTPLRSGRSGR